MAIAVGMSPGGVKIFNLSNETSINDSLHFLHFAQGEGMGAPSRIVARPPVAPGSRPWVGGQFCWRCAGRVELDVDDAGATRGKRVD